MRARRISALAIALLAVAIALFGAAGLISGPGHGAPDPSAGRSAGATRVDRGVAAAALIVAGTDAEFRTQAPRPAEWGRTLVASQATVAPWRQRTPGPAPRSLGHHGSSIPFAVAPSRSPPAFLLA
jgi:hypothetical protein